MFIPFKQLDDNMTGVWSIFLLKNNALSYFKIDIPNFITSFLVIILVILFQNYIAPIEDTIFSSITADGQEFKTNISLKNIILVINWFLWPLLAYIICGLMGLQPRYFSYIIIYNWSSAITITIVTLPYILFQFGLSEKFTILLILTSMLAMLVLKWRVIKVSLATNSLNASMMLFINIAFQILSATLISQIIR